MIYLFSVPLHSGRKAELYRWLSGLPGAGGFITPDREGLRVLRILPDGEEYPYELPAGDRSTPATIIGRYRFANATLRLARARLDAAADAGRSPVVVEEVGKLELRGRGLEPALGRLIQRARREEGFPDLLLVVRREMLSSVLLHYGLEASEYRLLPPRDEGE